MQITQELRKIMQILWEKLRKICLCELCNFQNQAPPTLLMFSQTVRENETSMSYISAQLAAAMADCQVKAALYDMGKVV